MKQLIILFICLLNSHLYACINHYSPYREPVSLGERGELYFKSPLTQREIITELQAIEAKLLVKYSDSLYSDYGAFLLQLGKYPEALHIFQQLIKTNPNAYEIIQNLGTAYELNGKLDSALFYIQKGLKINPKSHNGSEWIHVKILEAEIAAQKDPNYLKTHLHLLNLPTAPNAVPEDFEAIKKNNTILSQVRHQLNERLPFTLPPNPLMSNIFYEFGQFYYHFNDEGAYKCLQIATWYGSPAPDSLRKEKAVAAAFLQKRDKKYFQNPENKLHPNYPTFMIDSGFKYTIKTFQPTSSSSEKEESFIKSTKITILIISILVASLFGFWWGRKKRQS